MIQNDAEIQYAVNAFRLAFQRMPTTQRSGELLGRGTGSSLEFQEHREYTIGDDIRHLDWAAYGRSDSLMVRLYREEISPQTDILLDASRSMETGTGVKKQVACQLATLLMLLTNRLGGRATIHPLNDSYPPLRFGLTELDQLEQTSFSGRTPLPELLKRGGLQLGRKTVRFVISDFLFPHNPESLIQQLATDAGSLWVIQLLNHWEADPSADGGRRLIDVETGHESDLIIDRNAIAEYNRRLHHLQKELHGHCQRFHANFVSLVADRGLRKLCRDELCTTGLLDVV